MTRILLLVSVWLLLSTAAEAQDPAAYFEVYPVGERPHLKVMTPMADADETILFEANPIVRYAFFNDINEDLGNARAWSRAVFLSYRPQLRMYTDASHPVKMPSYRVAVAGLLTYHTANNDLLSISVESGHYSNGQNGCTYLEGAEDGSAGCAAAYDALTPDSDLARVLNRRNGNFSTNFTEVLLNKRLNELVDVSPRIVHSITAGVLLFHDRFLGVADFGGYAAEDIDIYGRWRLRGAYEHERPFRNDQQVSLLIRGDYILAADDRITPYRLSLETTLFTRPNLGWLVGVSAGHDNYNIRMVDSGIQLYGGVTWRVFPPLDIL